MRRGLVESLLLQPPSTMPKPKKDQPIKVEPGADKRLAGILKRALNTPPKRSAEGQQRNAAVARGKAKR